MGNSLCDVVIGWVGLAVIAAGLWVTWQYTTPWTFGVVVVLVVASVIVADLYSRIVRLQEQLSECRYDINTHATEIHAVRVGLYKMEASTEKRLDHQWERWHDLDCRLSALERTIKA
jgi:hypothetical protein